MMMMSAARRSLALSLVAPLLLAGCAALGALSEAGEPLDGLLASWRDWVREFESTLGGILLYHF